MTAATPTINVYRPLTTDQLVDALYQHTRWLANPNTGTQLDLVGVDLSNVAPRLLMTRHAQFTRCRFGGKMLRNAFLESCRLTDCDITQAYAEGLQLVNCRLINCDFTWTVLLDGVFQKNTWLDCSLRKVAMDGSNWISNELHSCDVSDSFLHDGQLVANTFRDVNTTGLSLNFSLMSGTEGWGKVVTAVNLGPNDRNFIYHAASDRVWCGCFSGGLEAFTEAVEAKYPDTPQNATWYALIEQCQVAREIEVGGFH